MKKLTYIVIAMMICFLTGCGSSSKNDLDQKELVYGYESLACMDEIKGDIMNFDGGRYFHLFCRVCGRKRKRRTVGNAFL